MQNTFGNGEVQRMMRDIGNSVNMMYGCSGSGAYGDRVPPALKGTFNYSTADRSSVNSSTGQTVWSNIGSNKPVLLQGATTRKRDFWGFYYYTNSHEWVCDGYSRSENKCYTVVNYHMNWGWRGDHNGWFYYNLWNPPLGNYQYAQYITQNIHP